MTEWQTVGFAVLIIVAELGLALALGAWLRHRDAQAAWREEPWLPYHRRRWRP